MRKPMLLQIIILDHEASAKHAGPFRQFICSEASVRKLRVPLPQQAVATRANGTTSSELRHRTPNSTKVTTLCNTERGTSF